MALGKPVKFPQLCLFFLLTIAMIAGCNSGDSKTSSKDSGGSSNEKRLKTAFVTNQIASFWNIAKVGCEDAAKELDVDCDVRMPAVATAVEQKRIVEDLIAGGIDAMAISPVWWSGARPMTPWPLVVKAGPQAIRMLARPT